MDNITIDNKFNVYINYLNKIKNIDFEWNANIRLKVNDKISSNLILHIQYDDDLIKRLQIRELFGLGLSIDIWSIDKLIVFCGNSTIPLTNLKHEKNLSKFLFTHTFIND